jgi:hypothetical protein
MLCSCAMQVEETIIQTPLDDSARSSTNFSGLDVVVSMLRDLHLPNFNCQTIQAASRQFDGKFDGAI